MQGSGQLDAGRGGGLGVYAQWNPLELEVLHGTVMELGNKTTVTEVILVGFTGGTGPRITIFIILLLIYTATMVGNVMMIVLVCLDRRLHSPMYFFICNLSLVETGNSSNMVPLMLVQMFSVHKSISVACCFTQYFFNIYFAANVFIFLPIMSYDRYVAICDPLHYSTIMINRFCIQLVIGSWLGSVFVVLYSTIITNMLPYCGPNIIDHFFCDGLAIVKLACADTVLLGIVHLLLALVLLLSSLGFTVLSYIYIISSILRIPSTDGRQKAFSTCSSHLLMVTIVYGSAIFVEVSPALHPSAGLYKTINLFSSFLSPLMNPFVYTYRNTVFKEVLKNQVRRDAH
ncbi:olfactory receptor 6M1-like [Pleurodeles waltl]|uniref:olfactory receptor 6M1-like n=1 Tax=Pleurodeles waltl TaxID=8319 RepID=UPI003709389D